MSIKASSDCLDIVKEACPPEQKIHLHCFAGGLTQVRQWRSVFPDCYFGATGKTANLNQDQQAALRSIPLDRLLLETDSPYLPMMKGLETTTPAYLGEVAVHVALVRKEPISLLIGATRINGEQLYQ